MNSQHDRASDALSGRQAVSAVNTVLPVTSVLPVTTAASVNSAPENDRLAKSDLSPNDSTLTGQEHHHTANSDTLTEDNSASLADNLQTLIEARNTTITHYTQDTLEIPAALVRLKWKNRREIYPLMMQEEWYGALLEKIMHDHPGLREHLISLLESRYQQVKMQETATLNMARKLADGSYQAPDLLK